MSCCTCGGNAQLADMKDAGAGDAMDLLAELMAEPDKTVDEEIEDIHRVGSAECAACWFTLADCWR